MEEIRNNADPRIRNLLKHAQLFLEDGEWNSANAYCNTVLETEPENTQAYLMKLMAELKVSKKEELCKCEEPFDDNNNYKKILQSNDAELIAELKKCNEIIKAEFDKEKIYTLALRRFKQATNEEHFRAAKATFEKVAGYKDSDEKILYCYREIEEARKESVYQKAISLKKSNSEQGFKDAALLFEQIPDYKDSKEQIELCRKKTGINEENVLVKKTVKAENNIKKLIAIFSAILILGIIFFVVHTEKLYKNAIIMFENGDYEQSREIFTDLGSYKESKKYFYKVDFFIRAEKAKTILPVTSKEIVEKIILELLEMPGAEDETEIIDECYYIAVRNFISKKDYETANFYFEKINAKETEEYKEISKEIEYLGIYLEAEKISVTDNATKNRLQELCDKLPYDYPGKDKLLKKIEEYDILKEIEESDNIKEIEESDKKNSSGNSSSSGIIETGKYAKYLKKIKGTWIGKYNGNELKLVITGDRFSFYYNGEIHKGIENFIINYLEKDNNIQSYYYYYFSSIGDEYRLDFAYDEHEDCIFLNLASSVINDDYLLWESHYSDIRFERTQ